MTIYLLIALAVLLVGILIYYSIPFFKKFKRKEVKDSSKKDEKRAARQEKKDEKREKKQALKEAKAHENTTGTVVSADDDFFGEKEDPDTKVNYDNFEYDGFFDETPKQTSSGFESDFFEEDENQDFSENIDDMFKNYFNDVRPSEELNTPKSKNISSDNEFENSDDLQAFLEELNQISSDGGDLSEDFKNLSPEIKALMISNFLDRKDI